MCGKYTSEEICAVVSKKCNLEYDYLWEVFVHDCKTMQITRALLSSILALRTNFYIVLITGNMDCFTRFTVPTLRLEYYFNKIVNSADEGQMKTDDNGATFLTYVQGDITQAFLIEDSEKSCCVFKKLGGKALQVTKATSTLSHLQSLIFQ